jgi:hypothetical protein
MCPYTADTLSRVLQLMIRGELIYFYRSLKTGDLEAFEECFMYRSWKGFKITCFIRRSVCSPFRHKSWFKKKTSLSLHGGRTMKPIIKIYTLLYMRYIIAIIGDVLK